MKKRMICLVSDQLLPNYIAVNEPATRPQVLYGLVTRDMAGKWAALREVLRVKHPEVEAHEVNIADAYDARIARAECVRLIESNMDDSWTLNATGGTKLMASGAMGAVHAQGGSVVYVETQRACITHVRPDWALTPLPFEGAVDVETYFRLYGGTVTTGAPVNGQERRLYSQLEALDWQVWASVKLTNNGTLVAEYDAIGIQGYRLSVFECKRLSDHRGVDQVNDEVKLDLYKLAAIRQHFGGPFGRVYWVFSGQHKLRPVDRARIQEFKITLIERGDLNAIAREPERFGLPRKRPVQLATRKADSAE